ncbi:MAG TPA: hypothetical protein VHX38_41260 [Pseudonocardiaceae bacterium]|jgi:hypothetical protein|nr:hypothetical protein [Pseudonocardiaceae bacterium]
MSDEKKEPSPMKNPIVWVFRASVLLLGSVIALNVAVAYLQPILPWLIGGIGLAAATWLVVAIVRWRRSRW